jgi:ribosomal protein L28
VEIVISETISFINLQYHNKLYINVKNLFLGKRETFFYCSGNMSSDKMTCGATHKKLKINALDILWTSSDGEPVNLNVSTFTQQHSRE